MKMDPLAWRQRSEELPSEDSNMTETPPSSQNDTNSVSKSSNSLISYDFSSSNLRRSVTINDSLEQKQFMIRRAESCIESPIIFSKHNLDDIFSKIGRKFKDIKQVKDISLEYSLVLSNGSRKAIYIFNDEDAVENLKIFYAQAEEMSPYPLIVHTSKLGGRKKRHNEVLYQETMKKSFSCDLKFYELLADNLMIAINFKMSRELISLVMGRRCLNLLSPGHFVCHIRGCRKILVLGGFSKLQMVERHWHEHQLSSSEGAMSCADLSLRYGYLKTKAGKRWSSEFSGTFEEKIAELETIFFQGKSLSLLKGNFTYIDSDSKFEGRPLLVDESILEGILNGDRDILSKVPKLPSIKSYFSQSQTRKRKGESQVSSSKMPPCTSSSTLLSSEDTSKVTASSASIQSQARKQKEKSQSTSSKLSPSLSSLLSPEGRSKVNAFSASGQSQARKSKGERQAASSKLLPCSSSLPSSEGRSKVTASSASGQSQTRKSKGESQAASSKFSHSITFNVKASSALQKDSGESMKQPKKMKRVCPPVSSSDED